MIRSEFVEASLQDVIKIFEGLDSEIMELAQLLRNSKHEVELCKDEIEELESKIAKFEEEKEDKEEEESFNSQNQ